MTTIELINSNYCKKAILNRKQLKKIDLRKHQYVNDTKIFINERLTVRKKSI